MKVKKQSVAFILGMIVLLAGTGTLMITAMREIKVKMNVSANTTLLNTTRMISDSLLNNFSSDQQQLETCANLFSRIDLEQPEDVVRALAEYTEATSFFRFYFVNDEGVGWDSTGAKLTLEEMSFDDTALSEGKAVIPTLISAPAAVCRSHSRRRCGSTANLRAPCMRIKQCRITQSVVVHIQRRGRQRLRRPG